MTKPVTADVFLEFDRQCKDRFTQLVVSMMHHPAVRCGALNHVEVFDGGNI